MSPDSVLKYLAEGCSGYNGSDMVQEVVSRLQGLAMRQLENSLCLPSSKWVPVSNQGMIRQ